LEAGNALQHKGKICEGSFNIKDNPIMSSTVNPPYLGAAYYPEDWPLSQVDDDIALMRQAGMNAMRIGEFAWGRMEPQEGQYDFGWLRAVVGKLSRAGIAAILGTPTATPPSWLTERYPESLSMNDQGVRNQHGARRHVCSNSPVYRDHCARIVTRMAEEFGQNPNVIGWQIDNELYPAYNPRGCCCPVCRQKFQDAMQAKYGTIEVLNAAWCNDLWSQAYQSFAQLPVPRSDTWHHPALLTAWMRFQSDSCVEFSNHQADILHRLVRQPVGTDMMPFFGLNYFDIHRKLDIVQFNHYNTQDNLWMAPFWMDLCRSLMDRPFWNTETSTCWEGNVAAFGGYREPGFCRANSWLPFALGGEANLYWVWRAHWAGQELMAGSIVSSAGRPLHIFGEVQEIAAGLKAAAGFLNSTRPVRTGLALHCSGLAHWMFEFQPVGKEFKYREALLNSVYRPMTQAQLRPDVLDAQADLSAYKLLFSPFLPALDEAGLRERLRKWIEAGGTWIAGPFTDIRDLHAAKFRHAPYGSLEEWAGVRCKYEIPGDPRPFAFLWNDGRKSQGAIWYDSYELRGAKPLATYVEGPMKDLAAVVEKRMGKGRIILLGTLPGAQDLQRLLLDAARKAHIGPVAEASANLLVVPRKGRAAEGLIAVELSNQPATLKLERPAVELLTRRRCQGMFEVQPYGVAVLKYTR
jgi:beta-galactosidase GanA